jgi:hypothetical protein
VGPARRVECRDLGSDRVELRADVVELLLTAGLDVEEECD